MVSVFPSSTDNLHTMIMRVSLWHNAQSAGLRLWSKQVWTLVVLLHSLSDLYAWERYEPPYPPVSLLFYDKDGFGIKQRHQTSVEF